MLSQGLGSGVEAQEVTVVTWGKERGWSRQQCVCGGVLAGLVLVPVALPASHPAAIVAVILPATIYLHHGNGGHCSGCLFTQKFHCHTVAGVVTLLATLKFHQGQLSSLPACQACSFIASKALFTLSI